MSINGDFGADFIHYARSSRYQRQNPPQMVGNIRRPQSTTFSVADDVFTDDEIYYYMVIKLKPAQARQILRENPPPQEFYEMDAVVKAGYLFYYGVYKQHFPYDMEIFVKRFYKEFYKYTCENMSDEEALKKICNHTYKEWQRNHAKAMSEQYRLMNDGRSTPDSRTSLSSYDDSDLLSLDSAAKEPLKFRTHHALVRFGPGGRLIILSPKESIFTIRIDHLKDHIANRSLRRNIDLLESFKGPLIYNETQPHTLQLFIERQIRDIYSSDVYKGNPDSNDTNDCLLIWRLLQMLIKQHGRVTGPDLAQLLIEDNRGEEDVAYTRNKSPLVAQQSVASTNDESNDLAECTTLLLRGCVDEAINSAIQEGCLFDALILAESLYANRPDKMSAIRTRLLATRSAQHPLSTLISVAEVKPVPLLASTNTGDGRGWRAHVAILLANLQTRVAYDSIYRLGLDLAKKEFNSAADFCFLAVNLLSGYNCFAAPLEETPYRQHISLINATLPDDNVHAARTSYGWSILDFCATEIFEFALRLASGGQQTALSTSPTMLQRRYEFAQMLDSLGGFGESVRAYCQPQGQWQFPQVTQQFNSFEPTAPAIQQSSYAPTHAHFQIQQYPSEPTKSNEFVATVSETKRDEVIMPIKTETQESDENAVKLAQQLSVNEPTPQATLVVRSEPSQPLKQPTVVEKPNVAPQAFSDEPTTQSSFMSMPEPQMLKPNFMSMPEPQKLPSTFVKPSEAQTSKKADKNEKSLKKGGSASNSSGWLDGIISRVRSSGPNEMKLPSDKDIPEEEKIRWDPVLNRYVGGVEEEVAPPPPPMFSPSQQAPVEYKNPDSTISSSQPQPSSPSFNQKPSQASTMPTQAPNAQQSSSRSNSMRRGTNRYSNAFAAAGGSTVSTNDNISGPSMIPDMSSMTAPTFGFIPMAADTDDQANPFSQAPVEPQQQSSRETSQETN